MTIEEAQREVRTVFIGGAPGGISSGLIWLASAAAGTWGSTRVAILILVLGGPLIFPIAQLILRLMGRRASLSPGNPMDQLAMQVAFTIPLTLPVVAGAALYRLNWFYPALLIVVGAHYLPFCFLYGMRVFAVLGGLMIVGGLMIGLYASSWFALGGWFGAAILLAYAAWAFVAVGRERTS